MEVNVVQSAISSRKFNKWFPWISGAVLVVGVIVFLGVHYSNTATPSGPRHATGPAAPAAAPQKNIAFPQAAWKVAREFVFTAVARKHLDEAYAITHPAMREGISKKEWRRGELPVVVSSVSQILKTNWKNTNYAHPRDAQINVVIIPTKGKKPWNAQIGLAKVGHGSSAHWLVNYFQPLGGPPVPAAGG